MNVPSPPALTIEAFLEELAFSDEKLEFFDGRVVAFAGGSIAHSKLCVALIARFAAVAGPGCSVLTSDAAVRVGATSYVFPDVTYTCEPLSPQATESVAPLVVVEVISPHSTRRDRVEKYDAYRRLPSLRTYLLVDSMKRHVTVFERDGERFVPTDHERDDDVVTLAVPELQFRLDELYAGIV